MNKYQKEVAKYTLDEEKQALEDLRKTFEDARDDINTKIKDLVASEDPINLQSKIYQIKYQQALQKQVDDSLAKMNTASTISEYMENCYNTGYIGTMYDIAGQGIPITVPIDQNQVAHAMLNHNATHKTIVDMTNFSNKATCDKVVSEVSRGIVCGSSWEIIGRNIDNQIGSGYSKAVLIARTEGHRIQQVSRYDAQVAAKKSGADVVKQWDATLDDKTRPHHQELDGQIREIDEPFETSDGLTAMYPGCFGDAAEDCNCRCSTLERARWALDDAELQALQDRAAFFGLDKTKDFEDYKNKFLQATPAMQQMPPITTVAGMKANIAALDSQMAALDPKSAQYKTLEAQKQAAQAKLDKKLLQNKKSSITSQLKKAQGDLNSLDVKTYSGIWKNDVTTKDWESKQGSIAAKKAYFEDKLINAVVPAEKSKWAGLLDQLAEFDKEGKAYFDANNKVTAIQDKLDALLTSAGGKAAAKTSVGADAFTQARKDAALWAKTPEAADKALRPATSKAWRSATKEERAAAFEYTSGSGSFNRPLSGFQKPYYDSGSGWEEEFKKKVGDVWINYEDSGDEIRHLTTLNEKSQLAGDTWLQRGCTPQAIDSFIGGKFGTFESMSDKELQGLVGKSSRIESFCSCSSSKGNGFSNKVIMNIYAPKGTEAIYAEPFSRYTGASYNGMIWDGKVSQSHFGSEGETIIQRGASYTITKVEKTGNKWYIDLEIHPEAGYDKFQQDPKEWKGSKEKYM